MLLEDRNPLQLKSEILANVTGAAANSFNVAIQNNPKRHSIAIYSDQGGTIDVSGVSVAFPATTFSNKPYISLLWDDLGDSINNVRSITAGAAATKFLVIDIYRTTVVNEQ